jgi:hypothetical protein
MGWKSAVCASALVVLAVPFAAAPAAAQTFGFLRFGNTASGDDPFCEDPTAAITMIAAGISTPLVGMSAEFNNGDWPWPPPNAYRGGASLTHGNSFQLTAEFNPLQLVSGHVNQYARPFIGVGLNHSTDGETRPGTGLGEAWAVRGQTIPVITAGANGILPIGSRFGLTAGYRYTRLLAGDFELETPAGAVETVDGEALNASNWFFGFTVQLGN